MTITAHKTREVFDRYNILNEADLRLAAVRHEEYLKTAADTKTGTILNFEERHNPQIITPQRMGD